jgi:hypothetical protein
MTLGLRCSNSYTIVSSNSNQMNDFDHKIVSDFFSLSYYKSVLVMQFNLSFLIFLGANKNSIKK